jgi:hypothetical protein
MENPQIGHELGFKTFDEIGTNDKKVRIESEKSFHCAAYKGLLSHISLT